MPSSKCPHPMCNRGKAEQHFACAQHWKGLPIQIRTKILNGWKNSLRLWTEGRDEALEFWRDDLDTMQKSP